MATLIGKVGMVMKGDYNSANTYEELDVVTYDNGLYVAKQAVPANTAPTNTTYWQPAVTRNRTAIEINETIELTTTFQYTGKSITIPKNKYYAFVIKIIYTSINPVEVGISNSDTSAQNYNCFALGNVCFVSLCGKTRSSGPETFYIWARGATEGTDQYQIRGWYED